MSLEIKQKTNIVSIPFVCAAGTDVGLRREDNEDTYIFDPKYAFFMVVDGMGGHEKGEVAAKIAAETIQTGIRRIEDSVYVRLQDSIVLANNMILQIARKEASDMGCVLTALLIKDETAVIGHIGDTRLYKIRRGTINKLTTDHSFVGKLEEDGDLSEKRLMEHPRRNEVTRCVGVEERSLEDEGFVDIFQTDFENDAAFLLCSDGLSDLLTTVQIFEIIEQNAGSPRTIIERLIENANNAGGKDNITAIFVGGKDFASEVFQRRNTSVVSKKQKFFLLFFNRWIFLIYGVLLGGTIMFLILYRIFSAKTNIATP